MTARTTGRALRILGLIGVLPAAVATVAFAFNEADVHAIVGNTRAVEANPTARGLWMARQRSVEMDGAGNAVITEHLIARVIDPAWGRERFSPYRRIFWGEFTDLAVRGRIWRSRDASIDLPTDSVGLGDAPQGGGVGSSRNLR